MNKKLNRICVYFPKDIADMVKIISKIEKGHNWISKEFQRFIRQKIKDVPKNIYYYQICLQELQETEIKEKNRLKKIMEELQKERQNIAEKLDKIAKKGRVK